MVMNRRLAKYSRVQDVPISLIHHCELRVVLVPMMVYSLGTDAAVGKRKNIYIWRKKCHMTPSVMDSVRRADFTGRANRSFFGH